MTIRPTALFAIAFLLLSVMLCFAPVHADTSGSKTDAIPDKPSKGSEPNDRITELQQTVKQLEQRVKELENEKTTQEEAVRAITRDALSTVGSNINEAVALVGTFEVIGGRFEDFSGDCESVLYLNTAQIDLEIRPNDWTLASLVLEYDDGSDVVFQTTGDNEAGVERINIDTAFVTIGDGQRFPPYLTVGRINLPFGDATGNAADLLTIEDPLTIDVFEMRNNAIGFGLDFPTPAATPPTPPVTPPPVRPLVIKPLISSLMKGLGYDPVWTSPHPTPVTPDSMVPLFHMAVYTYDGSTYEGTDTDGYNPGDHYNLTVGFHTKGHCGRPYDQLTGSFLCPWSIDIDVDYISSIFDSRFLEVEYGNFLDQIGFVPGMAVSVKTTLGPVSLNGVWKGAIDTVTFSDDLDTQVSIQPSTWQISLGYQFDWNPWVESIGKQGTYLALSYSESQDLAGVTQVSDGQSSRVGFVPKRRFIASVGEWILEGVQLSIEYSRNEDYDLNEGGTGQVTNDIYSALTIVW